MHLLTVTLRPKLEVDLVNQAWYHLHREPEHDTTFKAVVAEDGNKAEVPLDGRYCYHRLENLHKFLTLSHSRWFASVVGLDQLVSAIARKDIRNPRRGGCHHCLIEFLQEPRKQGGRVAA